MQLHDIIIVSSIGILVIIQGLYMRTYLIIWFQFHAYMFNKYTNYSLLIFIYQSKISNPIVLVR